MTTIQILQIIVSVLLSACVLGGIAMMSKVKTAVAGNLLSACAMLCGVIATLFFNGVFSVWTIYAAIGIGAILGARMARRAQMIQMPQLVALFNGLGGGASALVGLLSYMGWGTETLIKNYYGRIIGAVDAPYPHFVAFTSILAIAVGMITLTGSLVAAGKLHRILNQRPVVFPNHTLITILHLAITLVLLICGTIWGGVWWIALLAVLVTGGFGYVFAIRVGGADMPITISLLNSLSGVAGAIAGMAIGDIFLVAVGGIVGASGLLLTQIMCRAMNRSLLSILIGGKKKSPKASEPLRESPSTSESLRESPSHSESLRESPISFSETTDLETLLEQLNDMEVKDLLNAIEGLTKEIAALRTQLANQCVETNVNASPVDTPDTAKQTANNATQKTPASVLRNAKNVIIVPGYGMALAQAQHAVKQLADKLEYKGANVRFAIHPVAGRMPGHMNVLLAEADIPYEKLYEMDAINGDFKQTDAVVVIGANDVLNPAANTAEGTPIYGMPVLAVADAPEVIVCNYDLKPGYAGVENPLYTREQGVYLCLGDAKETLMKLINEI